MIATPPVRLPRLTEENRKAFFWPAAFFLYFAYTLTGSWPQFAPFTPLSTAVDDWVPFLPWTVWIYMSHIVLLFSGWWFMVQSETGARAFWAVVICAALAGIWYFFMPNELPRRTLAEIDADGATRAMWAFLLSADNPTNCFPSLHVAMASLAAIGLAAAGSFWRLAGPLWAMAIAATTLTTEQHVFVDVVGGILLAVFCLWVTHRFLAFGEPSSSPSRAVNG
ncbi:MAG: phosphatase PAP2 family protein [Pseudomonadota bacterium]